MGRVKRKGTGEETLLAPAVLYEKRDGIAYITFNRPEACDAMSPEVMCWLADAWQDYTADDSLRVAIITGAGDKAFGTGMDEIVETLWWMYVAALYPDHALVKRARLWW